jgi:hypothetical protein
MSKVLAKLEESQWNDKKVVINFEMVKRDLATKFMLKRRGLKDFVRWWQLPLYFLYFLYTPKPTRSGVIVRYNHDRQRDESGTQGQDLLHSSDSDIIESTRSVHGD